MWACEKMRETVANWAKQHVAPIAAQIDKDNAFPMHLWKEMGNMGFLGVTAPGMWASTQIQLRLHMQSGRPLTAWTALIQRNMVDLEKAITHTVSLWRSCPVLVLA